MSPEIHPATLATESATTRRREGVVGRRRGMPVVCLPLFAGSTVFVQVAL
jgi:hypothetical protein